MKNKEHYLRILKFHVTYKPTKEQIKTRFSELSLIYHPDKSKEKNASDLYRDIIEARDFLLKDLDNASQQPLPPPPPIIYKHLYYYTGFDNLGYTYYVVNFESKVKNMYGKIEWLKISSNSTIFIASQFDIFNELKKIAMQNIQNMYILSQISIKSIEGLANKAVWDFFKKINKTL